MPKIGEISINVTGKTDNLKRALKDGERATKDFSEKVKRSGQEAERAFEGSGKKAKDFGDKTKKAGNDAGDGLDKVKKKAKEAGSEIDGATKRARGFSSVVAGFAGGFASGFAIEGIRALTQGVRGAMDAMSSSYTETERAHRQLLLFTDGVGGATKRLGELKEMTQLSPFQLPGLTEAARSLSGFTGDLFSAGEGFEMLADVAAAAQVPFESFALQFGRLFNEMRSDGKFSKGALDFFRELGILTPELSKKLEGLVDANGSTAEGMLLLMKRFRDFKGSMADQTNDWDGMIDQMKKGAKEFAFTIGKPFFDEAKSGIKATIDWFNSEGGKKAQEQLAKVAKEAGALLKEVGPKFFTAAADGLVKFITWLVSDDAKDAIDNLANAAKWVGAIYIALKGMSGIKNLQEIIAAMGAASAGAGGAAGAGAGAGMAAGASRWLGRAGWVGVVAGGAYMAVETSKGVSPTLFSGPSGGGTTRESYGYNAAEALRSAGSGGATSFVKNPVDALRTGSWTPEANKPFNPMAQGVKIEAPSTLDARVKNALSGNLGKPPKPPKIGSGGRSAKSGPMVDAFKWLWDMIEDGFKIAIDMVNDQWREFTERMQELSFEEMRIRGASDADIFAARHKSGLSGVNDDHAKEIEGKMRSNEALKSQIEWSKAFTQAKKDEMATLREMAKELGQGNAIEGFLKNIEEAQSQADFGFWQSITRAFLDNAAAQKRQAEASHQAKLAISELKQEMGEMAKPTEFSRMLGRVWGGDLKDAGSADKQAALDRSKRIDKWREWKELQAPIEEQTKRYNDTLRDLALRLSLVGASSEEARMQLELLGQGMSTGQAQSIIAVQRMINDLEHLRGISERAADGLTSALMDSFAQIQNGAGAMFQTLVQGFRQTLAEMAQEYLRSMIRDILKNFIFSAFKIAAPSSGGGMQGWMDTGKDGNLWQSAPSAPSAPVVVNMTVNTPDVGGFRRAQDQIAQQMIQKAARAQRRNG